MNDSYSFLVAQLTEARKRIAELEEELMISEVCAELEIAELRTALPANPSKRSRTNDRTEVFAEAFKRAKVPGNARSILSALKELARTNAFPQLLGYSAPDKEFAWAVTDETSRFQSEKSALATIKRYLEKMSR
jgi:hypothetical protein